MKQLIIKLIIGILCTIFLSLIDILNINKEGIDILFTVTTIIFSVGMSLVVSSSTQNVHNTEIKRSIHGAKRSICSSCVNHFIMLSVLYILLRGLEIKTLYICNLNFFTIHFNTSIFMLVMTALCNLYLIFQFNSILELNNQIEEKIDKELQQ